MKTKDELINKAVDNLNYEREYTVQRSVDEIIAGIARALEKKAEANKKFDKEITDLQAELKAVTLTEISRTDLGL